MTPDVANQVAASLLLLTLGSVLLIATILVGVVFWYLRRNQAQERSSRLRRHEPELHSEPRYPVSAFGAPCRWLAIRSTNLQAVQSVLSLHNPVPCSWEEGIAQLTNHNLFISPPIEGWILIFGQGLPNPAEDIDECFHLVSKLSRILGLVQFFSFNRAVNHHAWAKAEGGKIRRAYAWADETLWNQGKMTRSEIDLQMKCFGYAEPTEPAGFDSSDSPSNSEKVPALAARWSIDPSSIDDRVFSTSLGVAGNLLHSRRH